MNLSWQTLVMTGGAIQLAAVASYCALSRAKFPKHGMRASERVLIVSAIVAAIASLALVDGQRLWRPKASTAKASAAETPRASCATIDAGMSEADVTRRLGAPDRRVADEETRGPGAAVLLYEGSRCAVHVLDGRVELVD